ncbi:hypothetical protein CASFOL_001304 [Castilleja foliolosa]|uniref:Uncharacterized protein n=1 Tax=Castilleja foliolosa TaxID=1961234 RepID=A0ABD3EMG4_9LAMI
MVILNDRKMVVRVFGGGVGKGLRRRLIRDDGGTTRSARAGFNADGSKWIRQDLEAIMVLVLVVASRGCDGKDELWCSAVEGCDSCEALCSRGRGWLTAAWVMVTVVGSIGEAGVGSGLHRGQRRDRGEALRRRFRRW